MELCISEFYLKNRYVDFLGGIFFGVLDFNLFYIFAYLYVFDF